MSFTPLPVVVLIVLLGLFIWWGIHSYGRLWREATTPYETVVYKLGVKQWGLFMWIATSVGGPAIRLMEHVPSSNLLGFFRSMVLGAIIGFPIFLWGGYWWGRTMASFFGLRPDAGETT